jgi:hypothetical protein
MSFPQRQTNWKRYQPKDLRDAFRACKAFARERKHLSVERIADLMGVTADCLYKWLADARMPAQSIPVYEHVCGAHFVTEYLAAGCGRMVVAIPPGAPADAEDLAALQGQIAEAVARLIRCYRGDADTAETREGLAGSIRSLAWHRENVAHLGAPELDLSLGGDDA